MTNAKQITALAKAAALRQLNANRTEDGKPPLTKLENQWWRLYGAEWEAKVKMELDREISGK